jgi:hypothetical protein
MPTATPQHYAFLVSETEFDEIWNGRFPTGLIPRKRKRMRSIITTVGRGFYFEDPNGHFLEVITRPYGSGGYNP